MNNTIKKVRTFRSRLFLAVAAISILIAGGLARAQSPQANQPSIPQPAAAEKPPQQKVIALIESSQATLSPELLPIRSGLAAMLLSDLAADPQLRVVSRERISNTLAETALGKIAQSEPATAQQLGKAALANILVALKLTGAPAGFTGSIQMLSPETGEPTWSQEFKGQADDLPAIEQQMLVALRQRLGLAASQSGKTQPRGQSATLAVFDFQPGGPVAKLDQYSGDLAELLMTYFSTYGNVRLVERKQLALLLQEQVLIATQRSRKDQAHLGRLLGAQCFLYTSMVQWGKQVRFVSQLVEPQTGLVTASASSQGLVENTSTLLQDLAHQIADRLSVSGEASKSAEAKAPSSLPLEATLHSARGYKLLRMPDYDGAIAEFEKTAFLVPDDSNCWNELVSACISAGEYDKAAQYAKSFSARQPGGSTDMRWRMCEIEEARKNWTGLEIAARAILADKYNERPNTINFVAQWLITALVQQNRWKEALEASAQLAKKAPDDNARGTAWNWLQNQISWKLSEMITRGEKEPPPGVFALLRQQLDLMPNDNPVVDRIVAPSLFCALLTHCIGYGRPESGLYRNPARDLTGALEIVAIALRRFPAGNRIPAMALMTKGLLLARQDRPEEALATLRLVLTKYPTADVDEWDSAPFSPPMNGLIHYYIGLIYTHINRTSAAAEEFKKAFPILAPSRTAAIDVLHRLHRMKAALPAQARWEKRVEGIPAFSWTWNEQKLVDWLRTNNYQLWFPMELIFTTPEKMGAQASQISRGVKIIRYNGESNGFEIQPFIDLRAWVANGGRLLLLCTGLNESGETEPSQLVYSSRRSFDQTLNAFLYPFGMQMDPSAGWTTTRNTPVSPTINAAIHGLQSFEYTGDWWPIICREDVAALRLSESAPGKGAVVAAAKGFGLGKIAVVTLRNWFPCGGSFGMKEHPSAAWEEATFRQVMDWLTQPQDDPEKQKITKNYLSLTMRQEWMAATQEEKFNWEIIKPLGSPSGKAGEEGQLILARMYYRYERNAIGYGGMGDAATANKVVSMCSKLAHAGSDDWIRGEATLWLARLENLNGNRQKAQQYFMTVAHNRSNPLWVTAMLEMGDMELEDKHYQEAAKYYREVASNFGHSPQRLISLLGLACAIEHDGHLNEAARLCQLLDREYGEAALLDWTTVSLLFETDPYREFYPANARPKSKPGEIRKISIHDAVQYRLQEIAEAQQPKANKQPSTTPTKNP